MAGDGGIGTKRSGTAFCAVWLTEGKQKRYISFDVQDLHAMSLPFASRVFKVHGVELKSLGGHALAFVPRPMGGLTLGIAITHSTATATL